jgi:hypothetical protein
MSLPTSVIVAPHRVRFCYIPELKDEDGDILFGQYSPTDLRIDIRPGMGPTRTAETILHEVLHAIHDVSPFTDLEDEEASIQTLAPALIRLMQDNPSFFPQLQALANQR